MEIRQLPLNHRLRFLASAALLENRQLFIIRTVQTVRTRATTFEMDLMMDDDQVVAIRRIRDNCQRLIDELVQYTYIIENIGNDPVQNDLLPHSEREIEAFFRLFSRNISESARMTLMMEVELNNIVNNGAF